MIARYIAVAECRLMRASSSLCFSVSSLFSLRASRVVCPRATSTCRSSSSRLLRSAARTPHKVAHGISQNVRAFVIVLKLNVPAVTAAVAAIAAVVGCRRIPEILEAIGPAFPIF